LRAGQSIDVDMFEQLPVPHGLVRFGVAPDHPKLKQVTLIFDRIAKMPGFRFFGGIEIGGAVSLPALRASYHAVVLATGASIAGLMDIPGETLPGSHRAADFVAWYNGHPDFRNHHFDLSGERAVIVGHGNVALDVARILAKTADELRHTDIAAHALDALAESRIRDIHIVGRRGAGGTKFAAKELMEFEELGACDPMIEAAEAAEVFSADASNADGETAATLTILKRFAERPSTRRRRCIFRFNLDPVAIGGDGRVERMLFRQKLNGSPSDEQAMAQGWPQSTAISSSRALAGDARLSQAYPMIVTKGSMPITKGASRQTAWHGVACMPAAGASGGHLARSAPTGPAASRPSARC
jgi:ferredoxin/flavodoxin---NADP+ reductase